MSAICRTARCGAAIGRLDAARTAIGRGGVGGRKLRVPARRSTGARTAGRRSRLRLLIARPRSSSWRDPSRAAAQSSLRVRHRRTRDAYVPPFSHPSVSWFKQQQPEAIRVTNLLASFSSYSTFRAGTRCVTHTHIRTSSSTGREARSFGSFVHMWGSNLA